MKERKATTLTWAFRDKKKFFNLERITTAVNFINNHQEIQFFIKNKGIYYMLRISKEKKDKLHFINTEDEK